MPVMLRAILRTWWLIVLQGIAAVIFGILAFILPGRTLGLLVSLFGGYALADGLLALGRALRAGSRGTAWWSFVGQSVVGIVVGLATFTWPGMTALVLLYCIAAWALLTGLLQIVVALAVRRQLEGEWLVILSGVLSLIFGGWLVLSPGDGALTVVWVIASYAIVLGVVLIVAGLQLRGLSRTFETRLERA